MTKMLQSRKGVALVEVVIALAVVIAVTVSAMSVFLSSTISAQKAVYHTEAQYFAADALACFRAAQNAEQFETAMEYRGGYTERTATGGQYTFLLAGSGYRAEVWVDYPAEERPRFCVTVTDLAGESVAEIAQFVKGDS